MRLKSLRLNNFGLFQNQEIELAPLTILFGANGAGKSTILDAIDDALTLSGDRISVGRAIDEERDIDVEIVGSRVFFGSAVVYATLDERQIAGTSDERIMRHVLWKNIKGIDETELSYPYAYEDCPPLKDLVSRRTIEMVESGANGTPEARTRVAAHLLQHSILAFGGLQGGYEGNWGLVCRESLDEIARYADTVVESVPNVFDDGTNHAFPNEEFEGHEDDELFSAVWALKHGDDAIVTLAWGDLERELQQGRNSPRDAITSLFGTIRPLPMRLEFEPATLDRELEESVNQIASRLTLTNYPSNHGSWLTSYESQGIARRSDVRNPSNLTEHGSIPVPDSLNVANEAMKVSQAPLEPEVFVLSPLIRNAVERIASHANSIAPKFLLQDSQIVIEIVSPTEWMPNAPRLRAMMREGNRTFPLSLVGSGIARWASYSIRLACQELVNGTIDRDSIMGVVISRDQIIDGETYYQALLKMVSDDEATSDEDILQFISFSEATPYEEIAALKILPAKLDVVLLVEEPEAHLHPRAVASIKDWLLNISPHVASVVVATHHPSLFDLRGPSVQKHVVLRNQRTSVCERWNPASEELVAQLAHQIGLTPGDLFMMSRFVLFVEGPHDVVILEEFFGDFLKGCMIRLVPLRGAYNISLLATSEIVWQMGIPIGVLTDGTNTERVMRGESSNHVENLVERMLRECRAEKRDVATFGLELDDILFYLDDEVTATFAIEAFPGWSRVVAIWQQIDQPKESTASGKKFKKWITKTFGLTLDPDSVREIAKKCKEEGKIPNELSAVISELVTRTI